MTKEQAATTTKVAEVTVGPAARKGMLAHARGFLGLLWSVILKFFSDNCSSMEFDAAAMSDPAVPHHCVFHWNLSG